MDAITPNNYLSRDRLGMYAGELGEGPGPRLMGADTLLGNDVYNNADEKLGDIKEIMLDVPAGRVAYAVLSFGGFLTIGEKLFAVPWSALTLDTGAKCFRLDATKERLKDAPGFDKDHWPQMADGSWSGDVDRFYGVGAVGTGDTLGSRPLGSEGFGHASSPSSRETVIGGSTTSIDDPVNPLSGGKPVTPNI